MTIYTPRLAIGLPVYNGEEYLGAAIDSILAQTFDDFTLIISDNASTDGTEQICRGYASRDKRVRYFRNDENIGGARNFNRVFELSNAEYFKWMAHDDVYDPEFVAECVKVLDADQTIILCYTKTREINEHGEVVGNWIDSVKTDSEQPHERLYQMICIKHACFQQFGVMRSSILRKTKLMQAYSEADRWLLAELSLHGRIFEVRRYLFLRRDHPGTSMRAYASSSELMRFWDPKKRATVIFPRLRKMLEYLKVIGRTPMPKSEKILCFLQVGRWFGQGLARLLSSEKEKRFTSSHRVEPTSPKD